MTVLALDFGSLGKSATCNLESATWQTESATCNLESATWQTKSATCNLESATWQTESATCNLQSATWQTESATCNLQSAKRKFPFFELNAPLQSFFNNLNINYHDAN